MLPPNSNGRRAMKAVDKLGLDKVTHFLAGALIAVIAYFVTCMTGATQAASLATTVIGGAAATIGLIILYVV